jgi:hypothetical protein
MHLPILTLSRHACRLLVAFTCVLAACASSAFAALGSLVTDSPFIPPGWHYTPSLAPSRLPSIPLSLELHGYSLVGHNLMVSLYDVRDRASFWLTPNDPLHPDIRIVSFDLTNNTVELNDRGRDVQLVLQPPSDQPMAVPPPTPPLVVYSPFYTGDRSGAAKPVAAPVAVPNTAAQLQNRRLGYFNNRGNLAAQAGGAYGRGAVANNSAGAGAYTNNNSAAGSGTGFGSGFGGSTTTPRRQIAQPTG